MLNFCTLFDSNYLTRGLALYQSLEKHCPTFHLYIFAFDQKSEEILKKLSLKNTTIISLKEFEDEKLLQIKPTRNKCEYCWTCTSSTILYVLQNFAVDACTYLDADIYFFANPQILINELKEKSVLITKHNYCKEHDHSKISGKYCVQFMTFKNNSSAIEVLKWWRNACIEWCYDRVEDGKFGDQKYLDDWMDRFDCVYELENLGGGIAPWNCNSYQFYTKNNQLFATNSSKEFPVVFYHFHSLKFLQDNIIQLASKNFQISKELKKLIYQSYLKNIYNIENQLSEFDINFFQNIKIPLLKRLKTNIFKTHQNLISKKYFLENGLYN